MFDPSRATATPCPGGGGTIFGNLERNVLRGPDQHNLDLEIIKATKNERENEPGLPLGHLRRAQSPEFREPLKRCIDSTRFWKDQRAERESSAHAVWAKARVLIRPGTPIMESTRLEAERQRTRNKACIDPADAPPAGWGWDLPVLLFARNSAQGSRVHTLPGLDGIRAPSILVVAAASEHPATGTLGKMVLIWWPANESLAARRSATVCHRASRWQSYRA
jgi:hypothetical protein